MRREVPFGLFNFASKFLERLGTKQERVQGFIKMVDVGIQVNYLMQNFRGVLENFTHVKGNFIDLNLNARPAASLSLISILNF